MRVLTAIVALSAHRAASSLQVTLTEMLVRVMVVVGIYVFIGNSGHPLVRSYRLHVHRRLRRRLGNGRSDLEADDADRACRISCSRTSSAFPVAQWRAPWLLPAAVAFVFGVAIMRLYRHRRRRLPLSLYSTIVNSVYSNWESVTAGVRVDGRHAERRRPVDCLGIRHLHDGRRLSVPDFPLSADAARHARRRGRGQGLRHTAASACGWSLLC